MKRFWLFIVFGIMVVPSCINYPKDTFVQIKNCALDSLYDYQIGVSSSGLNYVFHSDNYYVVSFSEIDDANSFIKKWSAEKACYDTLNRTGRDVSDIIRACKMFHDICQVDRRVSDVSLRINKSGDLLVNLCYGIYGKVYSLIITNNDLDSTLKGFEYQYRSPYSNKGYLYGRTYDRINESLYYRIDP